MAFVVRRPGAEPTGEDLSHHLEQRLPSWWAPDHWAFVDEIPKTSVGKIDKLALRDSYRSRAGGSAH